ncbi:MAG TPA: TIM-barrel domain-containing protein [Tepidisphaeraceae bacterium]|nr:TIM-barrel domain-containing protein [Tepidisphaeraceae bacterium]
MQPAIIGDLRFEMLSPTLVRIEKKGPEGFEDRLTFHVVDRNWPGGSMAESVSNNEVALKAARWIIRVPANAENLDDVKIESPNGKLLWKFNGQLTNNAWLPAPSAHLEAWAIADTPRLVRSKQGAIPAPARPDHPETSGWDPNNDSPDVYIFLPDGDSNQLRKDFLKLTGHTEMPPLFALGSWDSRWYEYTEQTALKQIDDYRKHKIPLDVLVIDTDWRVGGSHGYDANTHDFPDLPRFFKEAHAKHVRVMFNDHPEPIATSALDPKEMQYRFDNLSRLLNDGLDIWWFDRNWRTHLLSPMPGLRLEAWGMEVYHDTTLAVRPNRRPMVMANVDGIDHGLRHFPPDMATHRYPIQWTGDIQPSFDYLRKAVENAVHSGVAAAFAYESDDLGGHLGTPTPEEYIRWIEYGALSPIYRPHCTKNLTRMPWTFGPEVEQDARQYIQMRYRLLPVLYAAARKNYDTGEPILRRLDLDYPQYSEASSDDEYLLGHNILVAPVLTSIFAVTPVPNSMLHTPDGQSGLKAEYFDNRNLTGNPVVTRTDRQIDFHWRRRNLPVQVPNGRFSARWTGTLGPIPDGGGGDCILGTLSNDGVRIWIDGKKVLDQWNDKSREVTEATVPLIPGKTYKIELDYKYTTHVAYCQLNWRPAKTIPPSRQLWLPPGDWIDAWTGHIYTGPKTLDIAAPLSRVPLLIKAGSIICLAPDMQYTGQKPWDPITLDIYPKAGANSETKLYEDDGISNSYKDGACRWTKFQVTSDDPLKTLHVEIDPAIGNFKGAIADRSWKLRLHLRPGTHASSAQSDGKPVPFREFGPDAEALPFSTVGPAADGRVVEIDLPPQPVSQQRAVMIQF